MHEWFVYSEFDAAAEAAAAYLAEKIRLSLEERGASHVILPGGNTPARCFSYLSAESIPWQRVYWYLGDERCYPQGHKERNDFMLQKYLWSKLTETNIYRIPAELGAEKAALAYRKVIDAVEQFDVAFLGMGEDGHTASLFPGNVALGDPASVVAVHDSPKPPSERVSLGLATLRKVRQRMVLTSGKSKAEVMVRIKSGERLPINSLGDICWYVDEDAMAACP